MVRRSRRKGACCAGQDIHDAARVAERLGIAHYVLDYESRFRAEVIEDFAESYRRGETPVPCIRCNQRIKFRDLLATARDLGASALATGHYVRRMAGPDGPELHRARDAARDQSYFLFATTRAELDFLRFPLGGLAKDETRALARHFGLAVADKPDSQDICFVPQGSYAELVERLRPEAGEPGDIVDDEAACSAVIAASPISPWVRERGSGSPPPSRSMCWRSSPSGSALSSDRGRRWPKPGFRWGS